MDNLWNLLPPWLATRAKAFLAAAGGIAYVAVSFFPSVASNHWVAAVIGILTFLGVYTAPNSNARSQMRQSGPRNPDRTVTTR